MDRQDPSRPDEAAPSALLDALLAGMHDTVILADIRGRIVRASRSVQDLLGWDPAELIGENLRVIIPEPHRSQHDDYLDRYRETGRTWILGTTREFDVVHRSGELVPCELCVSRIDPVGAGPLFCGSFRDISERRRAREALARSEARFRAVFENANELVLLVDEQGRISNVNRTTFERTLARRSELIGIPLASASFWSHHPTTRGAITAALARAREVDLATARVDVLLLPPAARRDPNAPVLPAPTAAEVSVRGVSGAGPDLPRFIVEVRDVSALVAAERRESSVLRSLARVGEEAAVLAHELRSPVSALELALKAVARQLGEDERVLLDDLTVRMRRLEDLLRRTLSFSRPLDLQPVAIAARDAFGAALEREGPALRKNEVRAVLHVEDSTPPLRADPHALDDLLGNLVRNAAEAQPDGGRIRLSAWPLDRDRVELVIEDDGPGIPLAEREEVFRPFFTGKTDGTGLGLALVRKVAEEHGAEIRLEDGLDGRGLRVVLEWPAARVSSGAKNGTSI